MFELTAKSDKEFEIKMYGTISEWLKVNAKDFEKSMSDAVASGANRIILPTHCPGGSILEGIAMGTSIRLVRAKGVKVIQRVDGVSASMSAVIGSCCDEVEGAPFTRIMIHEGQWGAYGNVKKLREIADELERNNKDMAQMHAEKVNRTKPELKRNAEWVLSNWMAPGSDKWFTIDEAIKEGLADKKVAATVKDLPKLEASMSWMEMAASLDKHFDTTETAMDKETREKLIKELGLLATATDAEILAKVGELKKAPTETKPENKETSTTTAPAASAETVIDAIADLAKERGMTDEQIASVKVLAKTDAKAAMALIPKTTQAASSETKPISVSELIAELKKDGSSNASGVSADRKSWKFADWQKGDPNGLLAMAKEKPADYAKLFGAAYGYEPTVDEIKKLAQ